MASPVDTSVKFFHSAMANAPVLSGTVGAQISILDACLKDGFDLKTATSLVVAGGVATLTYSGTHSATVDSVILVAGSSIAALNGEQKVTAVGANTVSFATAAADGTASGTITFKMAPLGWEKSFSGTNLAAYRSVVVGASGFYLRVDDTGTTSCRAVGYESMTAISTGLGMFPTTAQLSGGVYWPKSSAASAAAVQWFIIGDGRVFYLHNSIGSTSTTTQLTAGMLGFGDMIPYRDAGDPWSCYIGGCDTSSFTSYPERGSFTGNGSTPTSGPLYAARNYNGLGASFPSATAPFVGAQSNFSGNDSTLGPFPSRVDGALRLSRRYTRSADNSFPEPRSEVPGILHVPQIDVYPQLPQYSVQMGTGPLAGRRLMSVALGGSYNTNPPTAAGFVDITGPWR